jgi:hypothetical protein
VAVNDVRLKVRDSFSKLSFGEKSRADLDDMNPLVQMINNASAILSLTLANDQANLMSFTLLIA